MTEFDPRASFQQLDDLTRVSRLLVDSAHLMDARDWDAYVSLFTDDARFTTELGTVEGRAAIRALFAERLENVPKSFHVLANITADINGDRGRAQAFWSYVCADMAGNPQILMFGTYDDIVVRVDDRWLFAERQVTRELGNPPIDWSNRPLE